MLIYFMAIWNILRTFTIFYDQLVHFLFVRYILHVHLVHFFLGFGIMNQGKSGNPDFDGFQVGDEEPLPGIGEHLTAMTQVCRIQFFVLGPVQ
jgi:hypothetical protein